MLVQNGLLWEKYTNVNNCRLECQIFIVQSLIYWYFFIKKNIFQNEQHLLNHLWTNVKKYFTYYVCFKIIMGFVYLYRVVFLFWRRACVVSGATTLPVGKVNKPWLSKKRVWYGASYITLAAISHQFQMRNIQLKLRGRVGLLGYWSEARVKSITIRMQF